jgi:phage shock protein PspC (stress-responsive transcriptional regulator)
MYCTSCGTQVQDSVNFCSECGHQTGRTASAPPQAPRRLYRLAYDKKIAGVCSGLARYLDVDVTLIRIAAVAVFFCSGGLVLLAYIAAIFIMPVDRGLPVRGSTEARATS